MLGEVAAFVATLSVRIPLSSSSITPAFSSRPDEEGDAGATRRASATRSHEPSRGTKRVLGFSSLSLPLSLTLSLSSRSNEHALTSCSQEDQLLPLPPPPPSHTPPSPAAHAPSLFLTGGSFLLPCTLSRETRLRPTSARILERPSVLTHTRARVDRVCPRVRRERERERAPTTNGSWKC